MPTLNFSGLLAILTAGAVLVLSFAQAGEPSSPSAADDSSVAATAAASTTATAHREAPHPARSRGA